ncbi:MAG: hypothetical protein AAF612_05905 [Planctomycetota bacterium]
MYTASRLRDCLEAQDHDGLLLELESAGLPLTLPLRLRLLEAPRAPHALALRRWLEFGRWDDGVAVSLLRGVLETPAASPDGDAMDSAGVMEAAAVASALDRWAGHAREAGLSPGGVGRADGVRELASWAEKTAGRLARELACEVDADGGWPAPNGADPAERLAVTAWVAYLLGSCGCFFSPGQAQTTRRFLQRGLDTESGALRRLIERGVHTLDSAIAEPVATRPKHGAGPVSVAESVEESATARTTPQRGLFESPLAGGG